jgi:hypothetical protein
MEPLRKALWQGIVNGSSYRDRAAAPRPETIGFPGAIAQGLYYLGFEVANVVVHGARK